MRFRGRLPLKDRDGIVEGSLWSFCPQKADDHKGDYHKVFNSSNICDWFTNSLVPNLRDPSLIMMDNALYHLGYGENVPKVSKLKKQ